MTIRVTAASRLHFGLLHVPVSCDSASIQPLRKFGGLGLMVERQGLVVEITESDAWLFEGNLAERAILYLLNMIMPRPLRVLAEGPPEHVGLGVGTALGMALAEAVSMLNGHSHRPAMELAAMCGRGERSGIGVAGFRAGGLIVDPGKRDGEVISDCQSFPFPDAWRIVVARPTVVSTWSGDPERAAFDRPRSLSESLATTARLEELLQDAILPALSRRDFKSFSESLTSYNRIAGEPFVADQGGSYSSSEVIKVIGVLQQLGVVGYGQSSWGPSVFAVMETEESAKAIAKELRNLCPDLESIEMACAAGPARVEIFN